jgi:TetR/AcrR family transcriptional repressor of nem operon
MEAHMSAMHQSKESLLDAAVWAIRTKGYEAARIEDVCAKAGLTKGSFFHHFKSKEELALAATEHFSNRAAALFEGSPHHGGAEPLGRLLAYVDFRKRAMQGDLTEFTCLLGMLAQETYTTHPDISSACGRHISEHADTLVPDIEEAKAQAPDRSWDAKSLALFMQAVVQGAFVLAKANHDPTVAEDCFDHLKRYLELLLARAEKKDRP